MNSDHSPLHRLARIAVTGVTVLVAGAALTLAPATASPPDDRGGHGGHGDHGGDWPEVIALPDGFQPEGIAIAEDRHRSHGGWKRGGHGGHGHGHGHGHGADQAFLGSRGDGDIWTIDLRTGEGRLVAEGPGTPSLGMKVDRQGRLFVAGGTGGDGRVIDTESGETLAEYPFTTASSFVNDVVLTRGGAWFTDSRQAQLYRVPWSDDDDCRGGGHGGCRGGHDHGDDHGDDLPAPEDVETVPLTGAWVQPAGFGTNGIAETPDHDGLIVVNSTTGQLFLVDPESGEATLVDLGGAEVPNGDGLLLVGRRTLLVVQNQLNQVAVVRISRDGTSGQVTGAITSDDFDIPTTVARSGHRLYLPNARFTTPATPTTTYDVTSVSLH